MAIAIVEWTTDHPRWAELAQRVEQFDERRLLEIDLAWHLDQHIFVALHCTGGNSDPIIGYLRYVIQPIGPDCDCDPVLFNDKPLLEGKVMGFAVEEEWRRQGIGRKLQRVAIASARVNDCYQLRSFSHGHSTANHALKLAMGFSVHPEKRTNDSNGKYFIKVL